MFKIEQYYQIIYSERNRVRMSGQQWNGVGTTGMGCGLTERHGPDV